MLAQGCLPSQIIDFMGGPYRPHQTPHPIVANAMISAIGQRHLVASSQLPQQALQLPAQVRSSIQPSIEGPAGPEPLVRAEFPAWRRIEPKPTGPIAPTNADIMGTYALMQQRFDQGDLAKTVEQQHPPYMVSREGALSAAHTPLFHGATLRMQTLAPGMEDANLQAPRGISQLTAHFLSQQATSRMESVTSNAQDAALASLTEQAMSQLSTRNEMEGTPAGTVNQGPRCAKCIKAHKRCTHRTQDSPASNRPLGSSPLDTSSTPSDNYVSSAGIPEGGYTPAPATMPDNSFTLSAASVEMPVQGGAKKPKAAPKRKR